MTPVDTTPTKRSDVPRQLSPLSVALLNHVAAHPGCTFEQLSVVYCPDADSGKGSTVERFRARLSYLVSVGHLVRSSTEGVRGYRIGNGDRPTKPEPVAGAVEGGDPQRTPAAQYDRMNGPAFTYTLSQPTRPGALDFKRCASVGYRC